MSRGNFTISAIIGPQLLHSQRLATLLLTSCFIIFLSSCSGKGDQKTSPPTPTNATVSDNGQTYNDDGQWTMPAKDFASTRFSGINEINASNVANMRVAWTFSTGVNRGQEAAPIVVGDMMYVVTPYPNILYALDLKNNGNVKWKYEPNPEASAQGVACCDTVNRGAAYSNGKVFINTLDGQTCAIDAATGQELWKTKLGDINM